MVNGDIRIRFHAYLIRIYPDPNPSLVVEEMDTNAMHGTDEVPQSSSRHLPPFETKGTNLSPPLSHTHTNACMGLPSFFIFLG